jgi:hypothetical protein
MLQLKLKESKTTELGTEEGRDSLVEESDAEEIGEKRTTQTEETAHSSGLQQKRQKRSGTNSETQDPENIKVLKDRIENAKDLQNRIGQLVEDSQRPPCPRKSWGQWLTSVFPSIHDSLWDQFLSQSFNDVHWYLTESANIRQREQERNVTQASSPVPPVPTVQHVNQATSFPSNTGMPANQTYSATPRRTMQQTPSRMSWDTAGPLANSPQQVHTQASTSGNLSSLLANISSASFSGIDLLSPSDFMDSDK